MGGLEVLDQARRIWRICWALGFSGFRTVGLGSGQCRHKNTYYVAMQNSVTRTCKKHRGIGIYRVGESFSCRG